ncbi:uncharacterized protein B0P05DRAFT_178741 [Gilbertella persicaria]|nr:uncharacterized protein B0P05DRAFT_178741 [Gilbertella persicaria]KAI8072258.1 hypothetical protein B0P05DRAFT_178741 [Gilbertella persicaria]
MHLFFYKLIKCLVEWSLKNNNKLYKYLCIGIGHPEEESRFSKSSRTWYPKKETGTMILFRLKAKRSTSSGSFMLKQVWTQEKLPGSVYSVCPHSAGLLFSAGAHLYLYRLDTSTGKLIEVAHKLLHSTITSIHGDGERICVTCHNDESISFYRFDSDTSTLHFLKSDVASRSVHHSLVIDSRLAVGVSYSGGMVALYDDPSSIHEKRLECLFSFHYSDVLVGPSLALLGSHNDLFYTNQSTPHILPWSLDLGKSNTTKPIVACTVSGGMLHVYRISSPLYNLFCVLQDLLLDFEPTRPLLGSVEDFKHWYCQLSGGEKSTIHGDLVESFLRLSFDEQLRLISQDDSQIKPALMHVLTYFFKEEVCVDQVIMFIKNILSYFAK